MKKLVLLLVIVLSIATAQDLTPVLAKMKPNTGKSPTVKIISPREGEVVRGKITIQAKVSDPSKVKFVIFYIQEPGAKDRYGWQDYSAPYFWGGDKEMLDTTLFEDGPASAVAFLFTGDDQEPDTKDRVHFIIDNGKPKVNILSPKDQESIGPNAMIRVDVSDPKGIIKEAGIAAVYIYLDGSLLQKLTKKPFQVKLGSYMLSPGLHSLRVVAEDSAGLTSADTVVVNVNSAASSITRKE